MISRDDWLKAVAETAVTSLPENPGIVSMQEFAQLLGVKRYAAKARMDALILSGKAERVQKLMRRNDGVVISIPAFRLVQE